MKSDFNDQEIKVFFLNLILLNSWPSVSHPVIMGKNGTQNGSCKFLLVISVHGWDQNLVKKPFSFLEFIIFLKKLRQHLWIFERKITIYVDGLHLEK